MTPTLFTPNFGGVPVAPVGPCWVSPCAKANNIICDDTQDTPTQNCRNKKFYGYIKSLRRDSSGVASLKKDGIAYSDSSKKAEILNDQFSSVFTIEDGPPPSDITGTSSYPDMPLIDVHVNGVAKLLSGLNPHKATGPDQLPARILKEVADEIAPAMTLLFQASLVQGCIPSEWSEALVIPIFKKGERNKASNYRPVSLTSIACKCLEHSLPPDHGTL